VAEGGGLLNRYRINSPIVGSNPIPSAIRSSILLILPEVFLERLNGPPFLPTSGYGLGWGLLARQPCSGMIADAWGKC
jgi:hypothetical protein